MTNKKVGESKWFYNRVLQVWSNAAFVLPIIISIKVGLKNTATLYFIMLLISSSYHAYRYRATKVREWNKWMNPENLTLKLFLWLDWLVGILFIIWTTYLLYQGWFNFFSIISLIAIILSIIFFFYKWKTQYSFYHSMWHIAVSLYATSVVASVVLSNI